MAEFHIVSRQRRGKILGPAQFGCLEGFPTLNVTQGCMFQCAYCYARGYSQAPPKGEIQLFVNLPDLLKRELARKKVIPSWVILNTSSDCFQPHPDILRVTGQVIRILLDYDIGISILTKGWIPKEFLELLRRASDKIVVQIGLVSFSQKYWRAFEPFTPGPSAREENIRNLQDAGIHPEVRMDPIIPFLTDTEAELRPFFERMKALEVERVSLSYLHLRPAVQKILGKEISPLHRKLLDCSFATQDWNRVGSSTQTKILPKVLRERGYRRIRSVAEEFKVEVSICQCKNPDLEADLCGSGTRRSGSRHSFPDQLCLFP